MGARPNATLTPRLPQIRAHAANGLTRAEVARAEGVTWSMLSRFAERHGITFAGGVGGSRPAVDTAPGGREVTSTDPAEWGDIRAMLARRSTSPTLSCW